MMKLHLSRISFLAILIISLLTPVFSQWAKSIVGSRESTSRSIAVEENGDYIYITGDFIETNDFDPRDNDSFNLSSTYGAIFIGKYNSDGDLVWANKIGAPDGVDGEGIGRKIVNDGSGNVYITGEFGGTVDFDPSTGTTNLTSNGGDDIFIAKYNSSGELVWAMHAGSSVDEISYSLVVDGSGNVFITGEFQGTVDFDPGSGTTNLVSASQYDIFFAKYNSSGELVWAKSAGGTPYSEGGKDIALDSSGNIYITGYFQGTTDFDPGSGTTNLSSYGETKDIFFAKYNSSGELIYVKGLLGNLHSYPKGITVDSDGNIYITGHFNGSVDFDPSNDVSEELQGSGNPGDDMYFAKYNSSGELVWAKSVSSAGTGGGLGADANGRSIVVDANGNVYLTGEFSGVADFDPNVGYSTLSATGYGTFFAKYTSAGELAWARGIDGADSEYSYGIDLDSDSNVYITGNFGGTVDFNTGAGITNLISYDREDAFFAKYNSQGLMDEGEYAGSQKTIAADNITVDTLTISDTGTITDLNVTISASEACDISYLKMFLQSPYGTAVELFGTATLEGKIFTLTTFDDESSTKIIDGTAPYVGSYQPVESLSAFDKEQMKGDWKLIIYHNQGCGSEITAWSIKIAYDSSTPNSPPSNPGTTYTGSAFTVAADNVTTSTLNIPDSGTLADMNVTVSGSEACDINNLNLYVISPDGKTTTLTAIGTLSGKVFYQTTFDDDASTTIASGTPPYFGSYQPVNRLSDKFNAMQINGNWTLGVYHNQGCGSEITEWSITVVTDDTAPSAPTNLVVVESGDTQAKLKWSQNSESDVIQYYIYEGTSTNPTITKTSTTSKSDTTKLITGLSTGTKYYFRVQAVDHVWNKSDYSNEVSVTPTHNTKIYVSKDGNDSEPYGLESAPYKTIQAAVDYSVDGDTIIVKPGTYIENIEIIQKDIVLGSLYLTSNDTSYISQTIIDGSNNLTRRGITINSSEKSTVSGFTITKSGRGGLEIFSSKVLIENCLIINNLSDQYGGGVQVVNNSEINLENTVINSNSSAEEGGGLYVSQSPKVTIKNSEISNNTSTNRDGGGLYLSAMSIDESIINIINSTIINNSTNDMGGAAYITFGVTINISNSIFWGNTSGVTCNGSYTKSNFYTIGASKTNIINIDYTDFEYGKDAGACFDQLHDLTWGDNNIDIDPLFVNVDNKDYNLTFYSPVIDKGNPDFDGDGTSWETDTDDQDPDGTRMDLGAYYFDIRDNKPPSVSIIGPTNNNLKLGTKHNITWTTTDNFPTDTIKIKLEYSTNFSSGVWTKIADSLANTGTYEWSVPNIPSANGGIKITATDFGGNTAADSSGKIFEIYYPSVTLQSLANSTLKISELVPIKWSTASKPYVEFVDLYYTVDDGTNWKDLSLNENNDGEYLWSVPNEPSAAAGIRIVAKEQFGYKDTADVKGLKIEIEYPTVTSVNPNQDNIWWNTKEIKFKTNIIFDSQTVNNNSVILTNAQADYEHSVLQSNDTITVKFSSTLFTYDSISIKLDATKIKSPHGYGFDGNGDGTPGDDFTILKKVYMPVDYDYSGTITASDVSLFVDYFKNNTTEWEPAPVITGTVPYVKIEPDGKYDIDDMVTFVQFGNWYLQGASGKVADDIGNTPISLDTTIQSKDYTVSFSELTQAIEVYVKYDPLKLTPIIEPTSGEVKLGHHDTEKGIISLIVYNPSDENIRLKWNQLDKKSESDISVLVKTTDQNGQETVKRTMLKVISVPSEFALHDNYPNPFNPTTTFRFDVPEVSDVTLSIYNLLGQKVRTFNYQNTSAGYHSVTWDATNDLGEQVGAGVYLYQLQAKGFVKTRKMVLLK